MTRVSLRQVCSTEGPFGRGLEVVRPPSVPEGSVVTVMRVPPEASGMRLDRFVQTQLRRTTRTRVQAIIARGCFAPDGRSLRSGDRVRSEQHVLLWRAPWDEQAPEVDLEILYEDDHLLAVNKPAGIPVHPTARYYRSTVVKMLEDLRPGEHPRLSHRIDRETSGVLLLAKTALADRLVKMQFEAREAVQKEYLALAWGSAPEDRFRVDAPLELDPTSHYGVKMRVAEPDRGVVAGTAFVVEGRRSRPADGRPYTLVRCLLETGRQHQIRVHLASVGLPLVGDKLYGPDDELFGRGADGQLTSDDLAVLELPRQALHAALLELDHPIEPRRVRIEAPLPADIADFWAGLGHAAPSP